MGLPGFLVERVPHTTFAMHADLFRESPQRLTVICGDRAEPFERRYAAGSVLAFVGDPRIRPDDPEMISIPSGQTGIGLPPDRVRAVVAGWQHVGVLDSWIRKECPRHPVHIDGFRIARYPVTNAEYRAFLHDSALTRLPSSWRFGCYPAHRANHPVWTVHPADADAYAAWLSARTGRRFRLPAEAEWEYAASGGADREYPWGDVFVPGNANTVESGPLTTTPVGIHPAGRSVFGADDMAGNVEEFVADDYAPYPGGVIIDDDLRNTRGTYRVARGGSFTRFGDLARCKRRHGWFDRSFYAIGFRLAESL